MNQPPPAVTWDWKAEGFFERPTAVTVAGPVEFYRVWGGVASESGNPTRPGVCLSFQQPRTRREAEGLFSVFEWGNACRHVTRFTVTPGATLYVGKAHPGDSYDSALGPPGSQVFIETAAMRCFVHKAGPAVDLVDDMRGYTVVPNRDPGRYSS